MQNAFSIIQTQIDNGTLQHAVLHVQKGAEVTQKAFGKAKADSMFLLGSITKPLTAAAVMVLVDRGELKLFDAAVKVLPEFSDGPRKDITIEQLLTHTSGLPDQLENNNELRAQHAPLSEFVKGAVHTPLLFAPGTKYHYQSMGILLAAEIVERVTKTVLPDFLQQHVFTPLGMSRTVLGLGRFKKSDMVKEFADAAFDLKKGQTSETPTKTQFGFHIIKIDDRRTAPPPALEELSDQIREELAREAVTAQLDKIRAGSKIEKFNMDGTKVEAAPAAPAAPAATPAKPATPAQPPK